MQLLTRRFLIGALLAAGMPGHWALAAEAPEGLGEGKHFTPRPQPVLIDALFSRVGPDEGIEGKAGGRESAPEQEQGTLDEPPSVIPVMRDAREGRSRAAGDCPTKQARGLRKQLAVTAFPLINSGEAGLGDLREVTRALPDQLLNAFGEEDGVVPHSAVDSRLYEVPTTAPTSQRWDRRLTRAARLSRSMGVQFVASGVIRDMSVEDEQAWGTSVLSQWTRALGYANQQRRLVVDLYLHDGFTGALLMQKRFAVSGEWPFEPEQRVGYGSAAFEDSDYGQQTAKVVEGMASAVSETLACQPFMANIERVEKRRIRIASGTESGLKPGDEVALYRSERFLDQPGEPPLLQSTGQTMRVEQVQSSFSSGTLPLEGHRMNIQRGDRVVIW